MMNTGPCIALIHRFLDRQIAARTFCNRFTDLWLKNRKSMEEKKHLWPEPYDEILIEAFQRGEIGRAEFLEKYGELWGNTDAVLMENMIHSIHSACSIFRSVPKLQWEIDEEQLRNEVAEAWTAFERSRGEQSH